MADQLKGIPVGSLSKADSLDVDDQVVAYRASDNQAYRATVSQLAEGAQANISDAFSSSKSYAVGDYCIYNDTLYKCTTAHSGSWSASDFEAVTVADELSELNTNLIVEDVSFTYNIADGGTYTPSVDVSKDGYIPLGIVGIQVSSSYCNIYRMNITGGTTAHVSVRGLSGMSSQTVTFEVSILYKKN